MSTSIDFQRLPVITLLAITKYLDRHNLNSLLQTSRFFERLLTPQLHRLALQDRDGIPALCWAAANGHGGLVYLLLEIGVNINACNQTGVGYTALTLAISSSNEPIARDLIAKGAEVESQRRINGVVKKNSRTALDRAVFLGLVTVVKELLERGAKVGNWSSRRLTPLQWAVRSESSVLKRFLMDEYNTDEIWKLEKWARKEVLESVENRIKTIIKLLLARGSKINNVDYDGDTPLSNIINSSGSEGFGGMTMTVGILKLLVENGASISSKDNGGWTPLHIAAFAGYSDVASFLLAHGADVNAINKRYHRRTPLHQAVSNNRFEVLQLLIEKGADVNALDDAGSTPLFYTIDYHQNTRTRSTDSPDLASELLENGANIYYADIKGITALHIAVLAEVKEITKVLLRAGANIHTQDIDGDSALDMARSQGMVDLLLAIKVITS